MYMCMHVTYVHMCGDWRILDIVLYSSLPFSLEVFFTGTHPFLGRLAIPHPPPPHSTRVTGTYSHLFPAFYWGTEDLNSTSPALDIVLYQKTSCTRCVSETQFHLPSLTMPFILKILEVNSNVSVIPGVRMNNICCFILERFPNLADSGQVNKGEDTQVRSCLRKQSLPKRR